MTVAAWRTYGRALKVALWANVCVVEDDPWLQCGWMDGGCFTAARAVGRLVDGELYAIVTWKKYRQPGERIEKQIEHVVVRTPDGVGYLDGDGFTTERALLARWWKLVSRRFEPLEIGIAKIDTFQHPGDPNVLVADVERASEVQCHVHLADEIERRLRAVLPSAPGMRAGNPLDEKAFEAHVGEREKETWSRHALIVAAKKAENVFRVRTTGSLYGCGQMGCAAELEDGRVLKLTIDEPEAEWAKLAHRLRLPGTVRVYTRPIIAGKDDWSHGETYDNEEPIPTFYIYAYVREAADDVPISKWDRRAYLGLLDGVNEAREVLQQHGYQLMDANKHDNVGLDAQGKVVVRDGRAFRWGES